MCREAFGWIGFGGSKLFETSAPEPSLGVAPGMFTYDP